jgi:hypothetical protein
MKEEDVAAKNAVLITAGPHERLNTLFDTMELTN